MFQSIANQNKDNQQLTAIAASNNNEIARKDHVKNQGNEQISWESHKPRNGNDWQRVAPRDQAAGGTERRTEERGLHFIGRQINCEDQHTGETLPDEVPGTEQIGEGSEIGAKRLHGGNLRHETNLSAQTTKKSAQALPKREK